MTVSTVHYLIHLDYVCVKHVLTFLVQLRNKHATIRQLPDFPILPYIRGIIGNGLNIISVKLYFRSNFGGTRNISFQEYKLLAAFLRFVD